MTIGSKVIGFRKPSPSSPSVNTNIKGHSCGRFTRYNPVWAASRSRATAPLLSYHISNIGDEVRALSWFWPRFFMMTSSNGNIFRVTGHLCGEFTGLRWIPRTKASDAELWCFLWCARLSKHSRGWWFETLSHPLWRHRNVSNGFFFLIIFQCPPGMTVCHKLMIFYTAITKHLMMMQETL